MAIDLEKLLSSIHQQEQKSLPPVHLWKPSICGEIDIHIDSEMRWFHEGRPFEREALVRLLASILVMEGDAYYLVTPQEKMRIRVDDVPFAIINMQQNDAQPPQKVLISNTEDLITLKEPSQWELREYQGAMIPYVCVRQNLWARVNRTVFYQMIDAAEPQDGPNATELYLPSGSARFLLGSCDT